MSLLALELALGIPTARFDSRRFAAGAAVTAGGALSPSVCAGLLFWRSVRRLHQRHQRGLAGTLGLAGPPRLLAAQGPRAGLLGKGWYS